MFQYQALSLQLYLLQDKGLALSELMNIQEQTPQKTLIIQFHLHISTNKQWLAAFKILYISSTFANNFREAHIVDIDHSKLYYSPNRLIFYDVLQNPLSNVFFIFGLSFFSHNITFFASFFIATL